VANDEAKGLKTIPLLYGTRGTVYWILLFTALHSVGAAFFIGVVGKVATYGIMAGVALLLVANVVVMRGKTSKAWLKALPLFHVAMLAYTVSMIADHFI